jgi:hypothetical protein
MGNPKLKIELPAMPDRDYPFSDMRLDATPQIDNAPGWREVVYAFATFVLMALVAVEVMLF